MVSRLILIIGGLGASALPGWTQDTVYLHPIVNERKLGFIDSGGREVIQPKFDSRVDCGYLEWPQFSEGLAAVATGERFGYIDAAGKFVIAPQFYNADPFHDGVAQVRRDAGPVWINAAGKELSKENQWVPRSFRNGLLRKTGPDGLWGYVDSSFEWVITPRFYDASDFSEGLALVTLEKPSKRAFIDRRGDPVIDLARYPPYAIISSFSDGLAWASIPDATLVERGTFGGGRVAYLDHSGNEVLNPISPNVSSISVVSGFKEGLAAAEDPSRTGEIGFINAKGTWIIEPQFQYAHTFEGGLARVRWSGGIYGYINKRGEVVWKGRCPRPAGQGPPTPHALQPPF